MKTLTIQNCLGEITINIPTTEYNKLVATKKWLEEQGEDIAMGLTYNLD